MRKLIQGTIMRKLIRGLMITFGSVLFLFIALVILGSIVSRDTPEEAAKKAAEEAEAAIARAEAAKKAKDALFKAAARGILSEVKAALAAGADAGARNGHGKTPLHMHMFGVLDDIRRPPESNANVAVVKALIEAGADPNAGDDDGWTPLHKVANMMEAFGPSKMRRQSAVVKALIEAGADPGARDKNLGWTPFQMLDGKTRRTLQDLTGNLSFFEETEGYRLLRRGR